MLHRLYLGLESTLNGRMLRIMDSEALRWLNDNSPFDGFTVYESRGWYKGKFEPSMVFEVIGGGVTTALQCKELARKYAERFAQESVLYVGLDTNGVDFISSTK